MIDEPLDEMIVGRRSDPIFVHSALLPDLRGPDNDMVHRPFTAANHCAMCGGDGHLAKDCPWLRRGEIGRLPSCRELLADFVRFQFKRYGPAEDVPPEVQEAFDRSMLEVMTCTQPADGSAITADVYRNGTQTNAAPLTPPAVPYEEARKPFRPSLSWVFPGLKAVRS